MTQIIIAISLSIIAGIFLIGSIVQLAKYLGKPARKRKETQEELDNLQRHLHELDDEIFELKSKSGYYNSEPEQPPSQNPTSAYIDLCGMLVQEYIRQNRPNPKAPDNE